MVYDGINILIAPSRALATGEGVRTPSSSHFQVILLPSPACLPKSKCKHACKHNFKEQKVMVYDGLDWGFGEALRTPSICRIYA